MKKIICLILAIFTLAGLVSCAKEVPPIKDHEQSFGSLDGDGYTVDLPAGALDLYRDVTVTQDGAWLDITADGLDTVRLHEPVTVEFDHGRVPPSDYLKFFGVYEYEGREFYITPDPDRLADGVVSFDMYHFSRVRSKLLGDDEVKAKMAKEFAAREIMNENSYAAVTEDKSTDVYAFLDSIYTALDITDDTAKGKIARAVVGEMNESLGKVDSMKKVTGTLTGVELVTAIRDGDTTAFTNKIAGVVLDAYAKNWSDLSKKYVGAGVGAVPTAIIKAMESGSFAEGAEEIAKTLVSEIPIVKYAKLETELIGIAIDVWSDSETELAYQVYSGSVPIGTGGYTAEPGDFDTIVAEMRGAYRQIVLNAKQKYCDVNKISMSELDEDKELSEKLEAQTMQSLKRQFDTRRANEDKINEAAEKYEKIIASFDYKDMDGDEDFGVHLLTVGEKGFSRGDDLGFRIERLMRVRDEVIGMIGGDDPDNLDSVFGPLSEEGHNRRIAELVDLWYAQENGVEGRRAVAEFVKENYGVDVPGFESADSESGKTDGGDKEKKDDDDDDNLDKTYAWELVETRVDVRDSTDGCEYSGTENEHVFKVTDKNGSATFIGTCETPPEKLYVYQFFEVKMSYKLAEDNGAKWITNAIIRLDDPEVEVDSCTSHSSSASNIETGDSWMSVNNYDGDADYTLGGEGTFRGMMVPANGKTRWAIIFETDGIYTKWIYEYKKQ